MASEERDRMFDKALARHWRSAATGGEAAGVPGVSASHTAACADPETLAAYHERSLLPEQLNSCKEHIVGCAHCQTVLSHLEMTDDIPLQAAAEEPVLAQAAATAAPSIADQSAAPSGVRPFKSRRRALLFHGTRWQWLAPAGAIAAGLLVWIAIHENSRMLPKNPASDNTVAKYVPPPPIPSGREALPPSSVPNSAASAAKPSAALPRSQVTLSEPTPGESRAMAYSTKQEEALDKSASAGSRASQVGKEQPSLKDRERDASTAQLTAGVRGDYDAKNLPEIVQKKEDVSPEAAKLREELSQLQNSQSQLNQNVSPRVPGPAPLSQAQQAPAKAKSAAAAPAPAAPKPSGVAGGAVASSSDAFAASDAAKSMRLALIANSRLISPPGSQTVWRSGRAGLIEISKDGGSTWSRQTSGVAADLLTGFAPSEQVCWMIGRAGIILLTTDGGAHWKAVSSPFAEDLGGVLAVDALRATIWNARGTKSFSTSDGGQTWNPVPHP